MSESQQCDGTAVDIENYRELRRRFLVPAIIGAILALIVFAGVLQGGRDGLFDKDLLGNFYDGQARAIRNGHLDVPSDVPGFEGFKIDGRIYIYQGLTPVIPRLLSANVDPVFGRLTGVSLILAQTVTLGYLCAAAWRSRLAVRGLSQVSRSEQILTSVLIWAGGLGLIGFLASRAWVYHEAAAWGVALSLGSLVHLAVWLDSFRGEPGPGRSPRSVLHIVLSTLLAGLAFNSRSSIGLGPLAALAATSVALTGLAMGSVLERRSVRLTAMLSMPARLVGMSFSAPGQHARSNRELGRRVILPLVIVVTGSLALVGAYTAVNYARFGSLVGIPLDKQLLVQTDPVRTKALDANNGSLFGLGYTPSVALQLLRPDAIDARQVFPYVGFPQHKPTVVGSALFAELDYSTSLVNATPLLFFGALVGLWAAFGAPWLSRRRLTHDGQSDGAAGGASPVTVWRLPIIGAFIGGAPVLIFGYMAQRYSLDFYPFLALGAVVGLHHAARVSVSWSGPSSRARRRVLCGAAVLCGLVGVWTTLSITWQYQREIAPGFSSVDRQGWLATQLRFPGSFDVDRVESAGDVSGRPPVGQLVVVGACEALYRWSGHDWLLLEARGNAHSGTTGVTVRVEATSEFMNSSQSTERIKLLERDNDGKHESIDLILNSSGAVLTTSFTPAKGSEFSVDRDQGGFELNLDVTEDPRIGELLVKPHGVQRDLIASYSDSPTGGWKAPSALPAGLSISVSAKQTPLCDQLTTR